MEYKYSLNIKNQKKIFLFGYYNRPFLWFQRRFSGPFLIILSIVYYFLIKSPVSFLIPMESFAILFLFLFFGIYITIRPLILLKRIKFTNTSGKIIFKNNELIITNEKGELRIEKNNLLKIIKKNNYLFIKVRLNIIQYYIIDLNSIENNSDIFLKEIFEFLKGN